MKGFDLLQILMLVGFFVGSMVLKAMKEAAARRDQLRRAAQTPTAPSAELNRRVAEPPPWVPRPVAGEGPFFPFPRPNPAQQGDAVPAAEARRSSPAPVELQEPANQPDGMTEVRPGELPSAEEGPRSQQTPDALREFLALAQAVKQAPQSRVRVNHLQRMKPAISAESSSKSERWGRDLREKMLFALLLERPGSLNARRRKPVRPWQ